MPSHARAALSLAILAFGAGLAGCGSSNNGVASKSASEILAASRTAAKSASAVHVTSKAGVGRASLTLNASLAKNGSHAQIAFLGVGFEAIRIGNTIYVKGNTVFDARLGSVLGVKIPPNTWLKGPATGTLAQAGAFTSIDSELPLLLSGRGTVTKGATTKINGQPAIELKQAQKLYTGSLYVATTGLPYPILLRKTGRETGQTTFTGWNDPVTVTPPTNATNISQLEHKTG